MSIESIPDVLPVIQWQRALGNGDIALCSPFQGNEVMLDPSTPWDEFNAEPTTQMGLGWLRVPDLRLEFAQKLRINALYGAQQTHRDGGPTNALETMAAMNDVFLYGVDGQPMIRPYLTPEPGTFAARIGAIISKESSTVSRPIGLESDNSFTELDRAREEMGDLVDALDEEDPLRMIGHLVINDFDHWRQITMGGYALFVLGDMNAGAWDGKKELGLTVFSDATKVDNTRRWQTFPGIRVVSSDMLPSSNVPGFVKEMTNVMASGRIASEQFE